MLGDATVTFIHSSISQFFSSNLQRIGLDSNIRLRLTNKWNLDLSNTFECTKYICRLIENQVIVSTVGEHGRYSEVHDRIRVSDCSWHVFMVQLVNSIEYGGQSVSMRYPDIAECPNRRLSSRPTCFFVRFACTRAGLSNRGPLVIDPMVGLNYRLRYAIDIFRRYSSSSFRVSQHLRLS